MNLKHLQNERGVALVLVLFLSLVVAVLSAGAAMIGTNASVINKYSEKASLLTAVADEGIEQTRSRINGNASLYPANGYSVLEDGVPVYDHDGSLIKGVNRWTYVGPSGVTSRTEYPQREPDLRLRGLRRADRPNLQVSNCGPGLHPRSVDQCVGGPSGGAVINRVLVSIYRGAI